MPLNPSVSSSWQRFVPSWGVEGTSIAAPRAVGTQLMAEAAVVAMINEVVFFLRSILSV